MNIRTRLRSLILVTLLPLGLLGMGGAYLIVEKERQTLERGVRDRVMAFMTAIEAEIQSSIAPLELMAHSPSLQRDDLTAFRAEAERAFQVRRESWENIVLVDPKSQQMLMSMLQLPGESLPKIRDTESVDETVRSRRSTVGTVIMGRLLQRPLFVVRVPVVRGDDVPYVLSATLGLRAIEQIADRQQIPASWSVAVFDRNYRYILRRPNPPESTEYANDALRAALSQAEDGWELGRLRDGTEIYRAFQRSALSGWSISIAVPKAVVEKSLYGLWLLIGAFACATVLGLIVAWRLALRISEPIIALAAAVPAVSRGEAAAIPPPGPLDEVRQLSQALTEAATAVREREEQQRIAEQALRQADRVKDEFLAMLGHELRNPLSAVSNAAQLLQVAPKDPVVLENVGALLTRQVEHMTRLADDLLEVGRLTSGKVRLELASLDLSQISGELIEIWRSCERFMHHTVSVDLQPVWVLADRARIEQIVSNLLDNALKYTPSGGSIHIIVRPDADRAVLEVSDDGEGMTPELIEQAFDLFVQGERGLAREPGGLGIGLTMVKRLVELHEGTIYAESEGPDKGTRFVIVFPSIHRSEILDLNQARKPPGAKRILIIEDNTDARESLAGLLSLGGHDVAKAGSGAEGLKLAVSQAFDVAIVDLGLPDIDGYDIARRLRHHQTTRGMRLIALTGYSSQEDQRHALAAGFDEHLAKPTNLEKLESLLEPSLDDTPDAVNFR